MSNIPMVDLQSQYQRIKSEVDAAFAEILSTSYFVGGPVVKRFSEHLAAYLDAKHVVPCGNGTDALQIALMALELQPGDEVITTPFTFVATAEVIALLGLKPVFVDVDPCTFCLNPYQLKRAITERSRCIIPVHLFGQSCNMEDIMAIAAEHDLYVVEDNAQAIGSDYLFSDGRRQKTGTIGHIGCTSFFPSKNLGCYGDGGALFTNDDELGAKVRMIANHGMKVRYYHDSVGVNSRLDALQAAVLDIKLQRLDEYGAARQRAAAFYTEHLKGLPGVRPPREASYSTHVYHQYTLVIQHKRDEISKALNEGGIATGIYYPVPLHLQKAYRSYGYQEGDFPVAEDLARKVLSLPMHTELTESVQSHIIETFTKAR
ncbi:MAG: DegT/DnrJ/EryC1/StrS family aminotransferase [Bacteroidota bacterium]